MYQHEYDELMRELHAEIAKSKQLSQFNLDSSKKLLSILTGEQPTKPKKKGRCIEFPVNLHLKKTAL